MGSADDDAAREPAAGSGRVLAAVRGARTFVSASFANVCVALTLAGVARQLLEAAWGHFPLTLSGFVNTTVYVYLMVIGEGFLIHMLLDGDRRQLRELIQRGTIWVSVLFVAIPLLNMIFHRYLFTWPVWFDPDLPVPHYRHYGPVGIHVAFALVLFRLPYLLQTIYPGPIERIFAATIPIYAAHYLVYYQVTMMLFLSGESAKGNAWSASFLVPVLMVFPYFTPAYAEDEQERRQLNAAHVLTWCGFLVLCVT